MPHQHLYSIGDLAGRCLICQDLEVQATKDNTMIQDMKAHWAKLTELAEEAFAHARTLNLDWDKVPPLTQDEVESHISLVLDVRDAANHLHDELLFLKGHLEGMTVKLEPQEEQRDERGSLLVHITPGTAPCSEIAESFGISTAKVVALARRLKLQAAGEVGWELADGTLTKARSYNLAQWKTMRDKLVTQGTLWSQKAAQLIAPARLDPDSEEA